MTRSFRIQLGYIDLVTSRRISTYIGLSITYVLNSDTEFVFYSEYVGLAWTDYDFEFRITRARKWERPQEAGTLNARFAPRDARTAFRVPRPGWLFGV